MSRGKSDAPTCDCMVPMLEGAGQHAPDCAVFAHDDERLRAYRCPYCPAIYATAAERDDHQRSHGL